MASRRMQKAGWTICLAVVGIACPHTHADAADGPRSDAARDWPGFLGPDRDGVSESVEIITDWPDAGPKLLWRFDIGPGFGGTAVREGRVYLLDRNGTDGDVLRVLDLDSGEQLWSRGYDAPGRLSYPGSRSTPMVTQTHAYTVGSLGQVTCFDLQKREIAWQKHMDDFGALPPRWGWSQSPLLIDDWVVIAPMAAEAGLVALDRTTGEPAWKSGDIGREGYGSPHLVELAGRDQIVFITSTQVSGLDPQDGRILWRYEGIPSRRAIPTPTAIGGDRLFVTAGYGAGSAMLKVKRAGEAFEVEEIARDGAHGGQVHSALLLANHLFVNLNTNENLRRGPADGLGCFDLDGRLLWKTDNQPDINRGPVLGVGEKLLLVLGGEDGVLRLIEANPAGYRELASATIFSDLKQRGNNIWGPMALADGRLLLRSQRELKCLDLRAQRMSRRTK